MPVSIRPIRPEDEPLIVKFHATLSEQSVYMRYFHYIQYNRRVAHERLTRLCFIDYDREMALVVERKDPKTGESVILAIGRLSKLHQTAEAEFAILVSDAYQGQGFGGELLRRLVQIGRDEKLKRIVATILPDNVAMQRVSRKIGFKLKQLRRAYKAPGKATRNLSAHGASAGRIDGSSSTPSRNCRSRRSRPFCPGRRTRSNPWRGGLSRQACATHPIWRRNAPPPLKASGSRICRKTLAPSGSRGSARP